MGSPDEPAHVVRAASLVRGQWVGSATVERDGDRQDLARVPETLAWPEVPCFAHRDAVTPACATAPAGRGDALVEVESDAARYNPAYYALVGWPSLVAPSTTTVYLMRLLTALLVAGLLTLAAVALREAAVGRWGFVALGYATTPMLLFIAGSVNPSAVEIAGGLALWATLLCWFGRPDPALDRRRAARAAVAAAALVLPRALGPLWLVLVVAGALLVVPDGRLGHVARAARPAAVAVAIVTLVSLAWTLGVRTVAVSTVDYPELESPRRYLYSMVLSLDDFERQMIGVLGWLDTPLPSHVYLLWFGVLGFLVFGALAVGGLRQRVLLLALVALSAVLPILIQWPTAPELGIVWQGRYLLPLLVGLPLAAGWAVSTSPAWGRAMRGTFAVGAPLVTLACLQIAAFWWSLHRNVIGLDEKWIGFDPAWQPPLGWIPLTLAYAAAAMAWTALLARLGDERAETVAPAAEPRIRSVDAAA
jgi:hypothetical protein